MRRASRCPIPANRKRGQATIEQGIFLAAVMAGLLGIQLYVQRSLNARLKTVVDGAVIKITDKGAASVGPNGPTQYEPYYTKSDSVQDQRNAVMVTYEPGGKVTRLEHSRTNTVSGTQEPSLDLSQDDAWVK